MTSLTFTAARLVQKHAEGRVPCERDNSSVQTRLTPTLQRQVIASSIAAPIWPFNAGPCGSDPARPVSAVHWRVFIFSKQKKSSLPATDWHKRELKGTTPERCVNQVAHQRSRPMRRSCHTLAHAAGMKTKRHVDINRPSSSRPGGWAGKVQAVFVWLFFFHNQKPIWNVTNESGACDASAFSSGG